MRPLVTLAAAACLFGAATARAGSWDVDGFYAAQQRQTAVSTTWGGAFYIHPHYWLDSSPGGFGFASQLLLGNAYQLYAAGAWRGGQDVFFEAELGPTYGDFGAGAAAVFQIGVTVGKDTELSYAVYVPTSGVPTFMPYIGVKL